jgi:hypothetical protein
MLTFLGSKSEQHLLNKESEVGGREINKQNSSAGMEI